MENRARLTGLVVVAVAVLVLAWFGARILLPLLLVGAAAWLVLGSPFGGGATPGDRERPAR